jgi:hypothetical protein
LDAPWRDEGVEHSSREWQAQRGGQENGQHVILPVEPIRAWARAKEPLCTVIRDRNGEFTLIQMRKG